MSNLRVQDRNQFDRAGQADRTFRLSEGGQRALAILTAVFVVVLGVLTYAAFQVFDGGHHWIVLADIVIIVIGLAFWVNPDRKNV